MGLEPLYQEFQTIPDDTNKQTELNEIFKEVIVIKKGKNINMITDVPVSYPFVVMDNISDYLDMKYKSDRNIKIVTAPIRGFVRGYKELNVSVNGKRVCEVLNSLSQFVQYVKNRTTIERLTGTTDKNEK